MDLVSGHSLVLFSPEVASQMEETISPRKRGNMGVIAMNTDRVCGAISVTQIAKL